MSSISVTAALLPVLAAPLLLPAGSTGETCGQQAAKTCSASAALAYGDHETKDIVDTALAAGSFGTLATALKQAGLVDALRGEGPFTVFAPTDAAFAKLPEGVVADLLKPERKGDLAAVLTYHVVPGKVLAKDVIELSTADTLNGQRVDVRVDEGTVTIDGAKVVQTDIVCSNGVIHVIDAVILPTMKDVVETAAAAGSFKTLAAALHAAGLDEALQGEGPFTVFAPTDAAFAKLPEGTVESLLKPENKARLQSILKYHVVKGRVFADGAIAAGHATTLQGGTISIEHADGEVRVAGTKVLTADVEASNGVIHVVDEVLMPR